MKRGTGNIPDWIARERKPAGEAMNRDEALKWLRDEWEMLGQRDMATPGWRDELRAVIDALSSSPCATCGDEEPLAVVEALAEQITETGECFVARHGGLRFFANIPALLPNMDKCDLLQRPIRILVFDDLPEEKPPAFRQGFTDGSSLLLEEPDFPGVPGAWEKEP